MALRRSKREKQRSAATWEALQQHKLVVVLDETKGLTPKLDDEPEAGDVEAAPGGEPEDVPSPEDDRVAEANRARIEALRERRYSEDLPALDLSDVLHGAEGGLLLRVAAALGVGLAAGLLAKAGVISGTVALIVCAAAVAGWVAYHLLTRSG